MRHGTSRAGAALAAAATMLLLAAQPSFAARCDLKLTDSGSTQWAQQPRLGGIASTASFRFGGLPTYERRATNQFYSAANVEACTYEDANREIVWPTQAAPGGLTVTPKVFVPTGGLAFARQLTILRNPGSQARTINLQPWTESAYGTSTAYSATGNGDAAITPADDWLVWRNSTNPTLARAAFVWEGGAGTRRDTADTVVDGAAAAKKQPDSAPQNGDAVPLPDFRAISIGPGETKVYMTLLAVRPDDAQGASAARTLASLPAEVLAGMSDDEKRALQNFNLPDRDLDGVANAQDNCLDAPNGTQTDTDKDGQGDACDADDDGDGVADAADRCPLVKGTAAFNGCATAAAGGTGGTGAGGSTGTGNNAASLAVSVGKVSKSMRLRSLRKGVRCTTKSTTRISVRCRLTVRVRKNGKLRSVVLASKTLKLGTGSRTLVLRPRASRIPRSKIFRVVMEIRAKDAAGNVRTIKRNIRVRR